LTDAPTTVLYRRDLLGRIVAAGDGSDPKAFGAWSYNADGSLASETLKAGGGAVTRSFTYDGLGRPVRLAEPAAALDVSYRKGGAFDGTTPYADGSIAAERITYSAAGFPAGTALPPGSTTTYAYDAWGRLTGATSDRPALNVAAAYDGDGNLTSLAQAGTSRAYAYAGATNRLATVTPAGGPAQPYAHDAAGGVTAAGGTTLVRDPATRQLQRATKGGQAVTILRDGGGQAAMTVVSAAGVTRKRLTLRDGSGTPLTDHEVTGAGAASLTVTQIHGPTGRIVMWIGGTLYVVSTDLRGSTRFLYAGAAKVAAWLSYCAYGAVDAAASSINAIPSALRWRYTGQEWVEPLGLYDYGARLYDPALGRFLSPDPEDETASPYMYVGGDPVGAIDPDGNVKIYWAGGYFVFTTKGRLWFTIKAPSGPSPDLKNGLVRRFNILARKKKDLPWPEMMTRKDASSGVAIKNESELNSMMQKAYEVGKKTNFDFAEMYANRQINKRHYLDDEWKELMEHKQARKPLTTARKASVAPPKVSKPVDPPSNIDAEVRAFAKQERRNPPHPIGTLYRNGVTYTSWNVPPFGDKSFNDPGKLWGWTESWAGQHKGWVYVPRSEVWGNPRWFYWPWPTGEKVNTLPQRMPL
jgi:RHS repeat-associated protein